MKNFELISYGAVLAAISACGAAPARPPPRESTGPRATSIPDAPESPPTLSTGPDWFDDPAPSPPSSMSEGDVAWAKYHFSAHPFCLDEGAWQDGTIVMNSEREYYEVFCTRSVIDWKRFRLVLSTTVNVKTIPVRVFRDASDVVVALRRECRNMDFSVSMSHLAVLIPAGSEPVRRILVGRSIPPC